MRRGFVLLVALLFASTDATAAASDSVRYSPVNPNVLVVGDSLTFDEYQNGNMVGAYGDLGLRPLIDAKNGRGSAEAFLVVKGVTQLPNKIVFAVGTNDSCGREDRYARAVDDLLKLAPKKQIYLVTLFAPVCAGWRTINTTIRTFARSHRNVHIVEWGYILAMNRDWLSGDRMHLGSRFVGIRSRYIAANVANS